MAQNPLEQLKLLSDEIAQEECILQTALWADLFAPESTGTDSGADDIRKYREQWSACLLLRALRIHLCLEWMDAEPRQCRPQLLRDWADAAEAVRKLSVASDTTGEVLSDTLDLLLLPDLNKRQALLKQLDLKTRMKIRKKSPLLSPAVFIALDMADYCQKTDRRETLCAIVRNLIHISESRNEGSPEMHRSIIVNALERTVDLDRPLTAQLCQSQQRYFEGVVDGYACKFYWFYGLSVQSLEDSANAASLFKRCHDLCMAVEGDKSWLGAYAGSLYHYTLLRTDQSAAAEAYLWDTLKKMDRGYYTGMEKSAEYLAACTRYALLDVYFDRGQLREYLDDILKLLFYCVSAEETNHNPDLTVRKAENLLTAYHWEVGELLLAATHAQLALSKIPPNGLPAVPSDILLYTNLLIIYTQLNDEEQIGFYTQKLLELREEWENDPYLCDRIEGILFSPIPNIPLDKEDLEYNRQVLTEVYETLCTGEITPKNSVTQNTTYAWSVVSICAAIIEAPTAGREELLRVRSVMDYFWNRPERYPLTQQQTLAYYSLQSQIENRLGGAEVLTYLDQAWQRIDALAPGAGGRITILRYAAIVYYHYGRKERALEAANLLLSDVTTAWQRAATYFHDHRVCQVLSTVQNDFKLCYGLMSRMLSSQELYEQILRFKDLPALVGRERNTLLRQTSVDEELISGLRSLQDRLADAELNDSLRGTDTARALREDLEMVEAGISAQFHEKVAFTEIGFQRLCRKLPEDSAIVEYYFVVSEASISADPNTILDWELDIFVTTKKNGQARLRHLKCPEGDRLLEEAADFAAILRDPDDLSASGRKAVLRSGLYRKLISPVLPFLEGITHLYIAPDDQLCNVPFEILYGEDRIPLQDRYQICRLICGRDLLFYDDQNSTGGGSFILGDPNYEAERGQRTPSKTRSGQGSLEPVDALPFSGVEARRIGRRCRSAVFTGDSATKYALRDALPCRIIHLATHGVYDETLETDSLYSSHLVFAGYNRWARNQIQSSHCGNGILTADEISRMDLKETELVVLSACRSGVGDTSYGSVRGLLSAFSAAGARWIISHMWEASDFSTPILMDAFYDALLKRGMDVPKALQYAKQYLKTVTIGQLRLDGWLELPRDIAFPEEIREAVEEMRHWPDWEKPFQDEYYWGGFTVHKSR